jgi:hypothetical protein
MLGGIRMILEIALQIFGVIWITDRILFSVRVNKISKVKFNWFIRLIFNLISPIMDLDNIIESMMIISDLKKEYLHDDTYYSWEVLHGKTK